MTHKLVTRCAAELAGTGLLVGLGTGTIVAASRFGGVPQSLMAVAWFIAVLLPIVLFIQVSGAHLNPVVTFSLAVSGRLAWKEAPAYWLAQLGGAFLGSVCVLVLIGSGAHLGATVPTHGDIPLTVLAEGSFTALLVGSVFVLSDAGQGRFRWRILLPPAAVGISTYVIGPWTGSSLNPARTLAPAVLSGTYTDLWVYLVAVPIAGLIVAAVWRPQTVDLADRGPGRVDASR